MTTNKSDKKTWAKIDKPLNARTAESALMAMKRMLVEWEYPRPIVDVDLENCMLKVGGKEVVKITVESFTLRIQWVDGEWERWGELQSSRELASIQETAQTKLDKAKGFLANKKGMSKGKGPE